MKTIAIIQARMGSTRLPGKMMRNLAGKPLLHHVLERVGKSKLIDKVVLATSENKNNNILIVEARKKGISSFAGSEEDVLDRFYKCAKHFEADRIVRITGDCPLIDPTIIDNVISLFETQGVDYASNAHPPSFPDGLDFDMFSFQALEMAWQQATLPSEREHVTPYIWKNTHLFKQINYKNTQDKSAIRLTVDEPEDLDFLNKVLEKLNGHHTNLQNILHLLETNPDLVKINSKFSPNEGYMKSLNSDLSIDKKESVSKSINETKSGMNPNNQTGLPRGISQGLYEQAKKIIPGGTQLFSKRPELYLPDFWPAYYEKAEGCYVWDLDGNKFMDVCYMGIGTSILGYADTDVNTVVKEAIDKSSKSTLNCPEEVQLAKMLCEIHPWAAGVRFARTGGEAVSMAVRIARAKTEKDLVLFCGYHGWHDWYLSANLADEKSLDGHLLPGLDPTGVPRALKGSAVPFRYNNSKEFLDLIEKHKGEIAAVVMEPVRSTYPEPGFLETVRRISKEQGLVLIFDEVSAGWKLTLGGAHLLFGVNPDLAVFAKGMGNGFPTGAVIGTKEVMAAAESTFISSSFWTERIGTVAAIATIRKLKAHHVPKHLCRIGQQVQEGWQNLAGKHDLRVKISGIYPLSSFSFDYPNPLVLKTLFTQLMLQKGFLATTAFFSSYAHKDKHIREYLNAVDSSFEFMSTAVKEGNVATYLLGPVCHSGFRRLT